MPNELAFMNSKNQNSDFCNEFIYELNFYKFMYLNSLENLWGEFMVAYNKHCCSQAEKFQPSATTARSFARPISLINLETNKSASMSL